MNNLPKTPPPSGKQTCIVATPSIAPPPLCAFSGDVERWEAATREYWRETRLIGLAVLVGILVSVAVAILAG